MTDATTAAHEQVPELSVSPTPRSQMRSSMFSAIAHPNEDHIRAFGKLRMILDQRTEPAPINRVEVINKDAAIGISHLQRGDFQNFAVYLERIINHAFERLAR